MAGKFLSSLEDIIIVGFLAVILLLLCCLVPMLCVIFRKNRGVKIGNKTEERASSTVCIPGTSQYTQTRLTGKDIERLQKERPSLEDYIGKGRQIWSQGDKEVTPTSVTAKPNKSIAIDTENPISNQEGIQRWREMGGNWSDPWSSHRAADYKYIRTFAAHEYIGPPKSQPFNGW